MAHLFDMNACHMDWRRPLEIASKLLEVRSNRLRDWLKESLQKTEVNEKSMYRRKRQLFLNMRVPSLIQSLRDG